jgi:excinuclease ABC subunit B
MYADNMTGSMGRAIEETNRRRAIQVAYNKEHGIVPETIRKEVKIIITSTASQQKREITAYAKSLHRRLRSRTEFEAVIAGLEEEMFESARKLDFEKAAAIRDQIKLLRRGEKVSTAT